MKILFNNEPTVPFQTKHSTRVAQFIIFEIPNTKLHEIATLKSAAHNNNGFGSTGIGTT